MSDFLSAMENFWTGLQPPGRISLIAVVVSLLSVFVAAASVIFITTFARRNFRREVLNQRLNYVSVQQKYFEDLKKWSDEISDNLSEVIHLCDLDPAKVMGESFFDRRHRLKVFLSSMIDRGRWFFPNVYFEDSGTEKPAAFRGYRHKVLDSLVEIYRLLNRISYVSLDTNQPIRESIVEQKKNFVSEIQLVLDPKSRQREFVEITKALPHHST